MRSHKDDLLHPAQPAGGHDAAGSHLGDVAQLMRSPNFMRSPKVLLNERPGTYQFFPSQTKALSKFTFLAMTWMKAAYVTRNS